MARSRARQLSLCACACAPALVERAHVLNCLLPAIRQRQRLGEHLVSIQAPAPGIVITMVISYDGSLFKMQWSFSVWYAQARLAVARMCACHAIVRVWPSHAHQVVLVHELLLVGVVLRARRGAGEQAT